ncbi:MAG: hypothetical protein FWG82_07145 [Oscillospiraceae bacterium]|nr:hypothetical protein [Oscillospiraceae bacterium]
MKKIAVILCIFTAFFIFAACEQKPMSPPAPPQNFTYSLSVTMDEFAMECQWEQAQAGSGVFTITAPETLSGLRLSFVGSECTASFGDMETLIVLPQKAVFVQLMEVIAQTENLSTTKRDNIFETRGELSRGEFVIFQDERGEYLGFSLGGIAQVVVGSI